MIHRATLNDTDWISKMLYGRSTVVDTNYLTLFLDTQLVY